jgi:hypothetical protein
MHPKNELELLQLKLALCDVHLDANETANLDRALRYVEAQVYNVEYPELRHRRYIPQDNSVPPGADSVWYRQFEEVGKAKLIGDYADDLPRVDLVQREFSIPVKAIGDSFQYSLRDLQRAAMPGGVPLDTLRAQTARNVIEWELDDIACVGRAAVGIQGLINNDLVDVITPATVGGDVTWIGDGKSAVGILGDLNKLRTHVVSETNQIDTIDTILLPSNLYDHVSTMPFSDHSDRTVLEWFKGNNPGITIEGWGKLDLANADGDGGRIVAYRRSPTVLQEKIAMEYTQLPPQARNLSFIVNAWAITAGTHIYRPKAVIYMDGAS